MGGGSLNVKGKDHMINLIGLVRERGRTVRHKKGENQKPKSQSTGELEKKGDKLRDSVKDRELS